MLADLWAPIFRDERIMGVMVARCGNVPSVARLSSPVSHGTHI